VGHLWQVTSGTQFCHVIDDPREQGIAAPEYPAGACVWDGDGVHASNEYCSMTVVEDVYLDVVQFDTEQRYDFIEIGSTRWSGTTGPDNEILTQGTVVQWVSDVSGHNQGFVICAKILAPDSPPAPPSPPVPPSLPPPPPTPPAPAAPTCEEDCVHSSDNDCDDGGPGAEYSLCDLGSDCEDCGDRGSGGGVVTSPNPPPPSPSPAPGSPNQWPGCTAQDLTGDFDQGGRPTLGDAVFVANARLEFGSTGVNPIVCLLGDFDQDGSFTLNDAAIVAEAQFGKAYLPWQIPAARRARRSLSTGDSKDE
jgi:hypothetical protein